MSRKKLKGGQGIFSEPIKELRRTLGKTQPEMASEVGVSLRTYAYWESGRHAPPAPKLQKLRDIALERAGRDLMDANLFLQAMPDVAEVNRTAERLPSDLSRAYLNISVAAELLVEKALGGSSSAKAKLLDLAARAARMAGDESSSP